MRKSLLEKLRCPIDRNSLDLVITHQDSDGHIIDGHLQCQKCQQAYLVKQGVPNLLPPDKALVDGNDLSHLQTSTMQRFGYEWRYFRVWGWLTKLPDIPNAEEEFFGSLVENTCRAFWSKSLFQPKDLYSGLIVLDAGCGNGRFTNQAAETEAEIIGIDLGYGVYSAFEHTRHLTNVHIVQGDLFRLPFEDKTFDRIFSIGVLMHTGNASAAFSSLVRTLRQNGLIVAHVYGKGKQSYELLDKVIRSITIRLPISGQLYFARLTAKLARWLRSAGSRRSALYKRLFSHINLLPTEHHMFDWWSAPVATHHTQDEVHKWFVENKLEIIRTNPPRGDIPAERARRYNHSAITVLGQKID